MKRIATHILLSILVLLGAFVAAAYFGTQALLEAYRPQIMAEMSDSVGCPITYRHASLRLTPALEVVLHDVQVMGSELGFEVTSPYFSAEVGLRALLNRHLDFVRITLRSPSIVLVTGAGVPPTPQAGTPEHGSLPVPPPSTPRSAPLPGIELIEIDSGRISKRGATGLESVILEDLTIASGITSRGSTLSISPSQASFIVPIRVKGDKRLPFTATLQHLTYSSTPKSLAVSEAHLSTGTSSVNVSGSMDLNSGSVTATIQGTQVGIGVIQQIVGTSGLSGTADLQATLSVDEQSLRATGTANLTNAQAISTTGERYAVSSLSAPFDISKSKGQDTKILSEKISVVGFSYADANVSLNHVNGTLSSLSGTLSPDGATVFSLALKGTGLDLVSGPFSIQRISSVESPLTVTIPAKGGYSISGPVKASGVEMTFHGRPMSRSSGSVNMLISDSILRFTSEGIQTHSNEIPVSVSGTVEITNDAYKLSNIVGTLAGGSLAATANIHRLPRTEVETEVLAKGLDISAVKALATGEKKDTFSGLINHLSVKATARKDALLASARGEGVIEITDGTVRHAQYDRKVVGLIKAIPVVGEAVSFTANATDSSTYQMQGGMLKDLTADFTIGAERFTSKNIKGQGRFATLQASGDLSFDGKLEIAASAVYLEQNLKALAGPITPLGSLFGTIGKIEIPLLITGSLGNPQVSADLSRLQDITVPGRAISPILRGIGSIVDGATGN
ncbi:MAG: hypothetical protein RL518_519 [Pseudomonadota bacterium]|jgi:hypothetical protein